MYLAGVEPAIQTAQGLKPCVYSSSTTDTKQKGKDLNLQKWFWRPSCCHYITLLYKAPTRIRTGKTGLQGRCFTVKTIRAKATLKGIEPLFSGRQPDVMNRYTIEPESI